MHAEAVIEATDVSGSRTFALKLEDDSMESRVIELKPKVSLEQMIDVGAAPEEDPTLIHVEAPTAS